LKSVTRSPRSRSWRVMAVLITPVPPTIKTFTGL
jgi:hypothetical protein